MGNDIVKQFELHKKWVETAGKEGEKLCWDDEDFRNFDLSDKVLQQANIPGGIFNNLKLKGIDFYRLLLCSSTYINAKLDNCDFCKSDLSYADFSNSSFNKVNFYRSDCTEAVFRNSNFIDCNFGDADFGLADFTNATFNNIDITAAYFEKTLFNGIVLKDIKGIDKAYFHSINIGTREEPILLEEEQAKKWIIENIKN